MIDLTPHLAGASAESIELAVARIDRWLETMRGPDGYGGPVAHWWRDSLIYCGPGLDWRYEGIIAGYLALAERSGKSAWLWKARRAGDDLVRRQRADGQFPASQFEANPASGGTPHEAAADVALLLLAGALRDRGDPSWCGYADAAATNLRSLYLERLWNERDQRFWDAPGIRSFVPNKAATAIEAVCLLADLTGDAGLVERYVGPNADAILGLQVGAPGDPLDGAIAQNVLGTAVVEKYFPFYVARCVPGLLAAHRRLGGGRYLDAALRAMRFVGRWRDPDGGFPQVLYPGGRVNRYPRWIAATGDVLRAAELLRPFGLDFAAEPTERWLLAGLLPSGGIATAHGFGAQVRQRTSTGPELRDLLPVCGWVDKAFRYLASRADGLSSGVSEVVLARGQELTCSFSGHPVVLAENDTAIEVRHRGQPVYRWAKGTAWAEVRAPWMVTA